MNRDELTHAEPIDRLSHREYERQQLLQELKDAINNIEQTDIVLFREDEKLFRTLITGSLMVFLGREIALEAWPGDRHAYGMVFASAVEASSLFQNVIMPRIRLFTRSEAERNLIIADLFDYLATSYTQSIRSEFLRVTIHERKKFFETIGYPIDGCS